ncbi:DUF934 domain-containing protein [Kiloniella sp. EL199]|uniref:DUF934 domain-containing protein n=1 Tax=Kiloniella sp. EL199 TaxID=2107581 RepID=UPI000EA22B1D|nr:DUF934 domain-containing protein [Kiloniella sp. EL199]
MPLIKDGRQIADKWIKLDDEAEVPAGASVIVSLDRWKNEKETLIDLGLELGVLLESNESPELIEDDLNKLSLVALNFPAFGDGRAYSYARILKERYGFEGEVRAVGDVLYDQIQLMQRCGFDTLDIESEATLRSLNRNKSADVNVFYQPTGDGEATASSLRKRLIESHNELGYNKAS